jgi:hypothetical protein
MSQRPVPRFVDPADPRAPPQDIWDRMSEAERERVVESLPSEFAINDMVNQLELKLVEAEQRAEEEARRREQAERQLADALAEIESLKAPRSEG